MRSTHFLALLRISLRSGFDLRDGVGADPGRDGRASANARTALSRHSSRGGLHARSNCKPPFIHDAGCRRANGDLDRVARAWRGVGRHHRRPLRRPRTARRPPRSDCPGEVTFLPAGARPCAARSSASRAAFALPALGSKPHRRRAPGHRREHARTARRNLDYVLTRGRGLMAQVPGWRWSRPKGPPPPRPCRRPYPRDGTDAARLSRSISRLRHRVPFPPRSRRRRGGRSVCR